MSNSLLNRLAVIYGAPDSEDPGAYLGEVAKLLSGFSEAELSKAGDALLSSHRGRQWPTPAQCVEACQNAKEAGSTPRAPEGPRHPEWSREARAVADRLVVSDMGRIAADEGWALALHDFCRVARRLPNATEQHRLKRTAKAFDEAYAECCRGEGGLLGASLRNLGESMLQRRERYAGKAYGEIEG